MALMPVAASPAISSAVVPTDTVFTVDWTFVAQFARLLDDGSPGELGLGGYVEGVGVGLEQLG